MRIALIGRGRLASNLAPALTEAGHDVVTINSRTLDGLPREADIFIFAVKDDALAEVIARAAQGREDQLFVHTAGSLPMMLFDGHVPHCGVFYPMQSFSKERRVDFRTIPIFLEASDDASLATMKTLADTISDSVYELDTAGRKYLHLAAVFACNFVNHCYALAADVLAQRNLPFNVMLPLIDETARKVHQLHPRQAQTGPAVRRDRNVIDMQSQLLADHPQLQRIYNLLSQSIQQND
jgi:predicted short-subunit dehydrogenase-like oxidoreductase (DUF2520 family)